MHCQYYKKDDYCSCEIVNEVLGKHVPLHCITSKHSPCHQCLQEGEPSKENPSKTVLRIIDADKTQLDTVDLAKNYVTALTEYAMDGFKSTPENIVEERLNICKSCEFYDIEKEKCKQCGCSLSGGMAINNKLRMAHESCPIGKWGPHKDT